MAQLDPLQKISQTSKTPQSNSPTFEQLLQGNERSWSTNTSPTAYDQEEYTPTHGKKSVITKVKEKAKKLKYSLSGKKKLHENDVHDHDHDHNDNSTPSWGANLGDDNNTPSWGATLDEEDEEDEDPEYLGAPMYESELAPEAYKEAARQHPRADPVVSEKHAVPTSIKHEFIEQDNKETFPDSPSKTITETVTEKLAPAYAAVSDATHAIASKISGLTLTNTSNEQESGNEHAAPKTGHFAETNVNKLGPNVEQNAGGFSSPGKWDKGVSVKEYFVEKFEPGEGERSLSQIITEAMSPRQAASGDKGIVEKMKGAVTSLIRPDDSPKSTENSIKSSSAPNNPISTSATLSPKCPSLSSKTTIISTNDNLPQDNPIDMPHKSPISTASSLSQFPEFHSASSSPLIPISTSVHEVVEEQSHGRILQPN